MSLLYLSILVFFISVVGRIFSNAFINENINKVCNFIGRNGFILAFLLILLFVYVNSNTQSTNTKTINININNKGGVTMDVNRS
jgi:hypothetical protein